MVFSVLSISVTADAATNKVVCKKYTYNTRKQAPVLKVDKTYQIAYKGTRGVVQFEAPKSKVYTFSFSNYRSIGISKNKDLGYVTVIPFDDDCYKEMEKNKNLFSWLEWKSLQYDDDSFLEFGSKRYSSQSGSDFYVSTSNKGKLKLK